MKKQTTVGIASRNICPVICANVGDAKWVSIAVQFAKNLIINRNIKQYVKD